MTTKDRDQGEGQWHKCDGCGEIETKELYSEQAQVCLHCDHHHAISPLKRLHLWVDEGSFRPYDSDIASNDPLGFTDTKPYCDRLKGYALKTGRNHAIVSGEASIDGCGVQIAMLDFSYAGGSMGSVEGELITRTIERATALNQALIILSASGGARMQESIFALMQMAKTCAALAQFKKNVRKPYISMMTHPTSGGVTASFAMMGDFNIAEPGALICFAGPRVIKQTIGQDLPAGFQTAEFLLEHGMIDRVCHRRDQRELLTRLIGLLK